MRRTFLLMLFVGVAACTEASPQEPTSTTSEPQVQIEATGFLFQPPEVEVTVGGGVLFTNTDRILHTVTSGTPDQPDDLFDRQLDGAGTSATIAFEEAGVYPFFCTRHPHMTGTVSVTEAG